MRTPTSKVAKLLRIFERKKTPPPELIKFKSQKTKMPVIKKKTSRQLVMEDIREGTMAAASNTSDEDFPPMEKRPIRPKKTKKEVGEATKETIVEKGEPEKKGQSMVAASAATAAAAAATAPGMATPPTMRSFLERGAAQAANSKVVTSTAQKRLREDAGSEEEPDKQDVDQLLSSSWTEVQQLLEDAGAGHIFQAIKEKFCQMLEKVWEKQLGKMKAATISAISTDKELDRCGRSIIIHNADKMVPIGNETFNGRGDRLFNYSLADRVTETLHTQCNMMIAVQEAYSLGWRNGKPSTSVCVVLGSRHQKGVVYRTVAGHMRAKTAFGEMLQTVSVRDAFPKDKLPDSRKLVQKGMELKRRGKVATFKVVAKGAGCFPVLEVKKKGGRWEVHQDEPEEENVEQMEEEMEDENGRPYRTDPLLEGVPPAVQDEFFKRADARMAAQGISD